MYRRNKRKGGGKLLRSPPKGCLASNFAIDAVPRRGRIVVTAAVAVMVMELESLRIVGHERVVASSGVVVVHDGSGWT